MVEMTQEERRMRKSGSFLLLLALFLWLFVGPSVALFFTTLPFFDSDLGAFVVMFIPYLFLFFTLLLGARLLYRKSIFSLVGNLKGNGFYLLSSGILYFVLTVLFTFIGSSSIEKAPYGSGEMLLFLLPALVLVSMQTFSEEVFFRVIPARIFYPGDLPKGGKMLPLMFGSGLFFLLPHLGNPEVLHSGTALFSIFFYFLWGTLAMGLGLYARNFWVTVIIHDINNLFVALLVNYEHSALPSKALFINRGETSSFKQLLILVSLFLVEFVLTYVYRKTERKKES